MSEPFHDSASELLGMVAPQLRLNPAAVSTVAKCLTATALYARRDADARAEAAESRADSLQAKVRRAYEDAEDALQRFLAKQDHRAMTAYDAIDLCIAEIRARALAAERTARLLPASTEASR